MKKLNLELTVDQVNLLLKGLSELPFKESSSLISEIQAQAAPQLQPIVPPIVESNGSEG